MHLLEKYSLNCGINPNKLGKPYIYESYYPVPFTKYIVFHSSSGMQSKNYSRYQEIVDFCKKDLFDAGYGIVQIGGKEDQKLKDCLNLNGVTNIHQTAYILKNASLLVANDSFSTHICSAFNIPTITLYSVSPPEVCGPFWRGEKNICIMAPLNDKKPCYSNVDPDRSIDKIKPEEVIDQIYSILNLKTNAKLRSIYFGDSYGKYELNLVPDSSFFVDISPESILQIRFDLLKNKINNSNLESAAINLQRRKCAIFTRQPIPIEFFSINEIKTNSEALFLDICKENLNEIDELISFASSFKKTGIPMVVRTLEPNLSEDEVNRVKLKFIDVSNVWSKKNDNIKNEILKDISKQAKILTLVKSSSIIFSKGSLFLSEASMKKNKPCQASLIQRLSDIGDVFSLREDLENLYLFNIEEKNASKK